MKYLRYYTEFVDNGGTSYRIEIMQDALEAFTPKQVTLVAESPLTIDWHKIEKSETLMSSAVTLVLNSDEDRQFLDMYQVELGVVRLDIYKEGALYWSGSLDTELYEEPYSFLKNYNVSLTFSDFAILERKEFSLAGFKSIEEIVIAVIEQTGIKYENIVRYISTSRKGVAANKLLTEDVVICDNFYDEDGEAMSFQEALESVLKIYDLHIKQKYGKIFIWDWNAVYTLSEEKIEWDSDDAVLGVDPVYNKVIINFSPYQVKTLIESEVESKSYVADSQDYLVYDTNERILEGFTISYGLLL